MSAAGRKCLVLAVLLVLISFPNASFELSFRFGADDKKATDEIAEASRGIKEKRFKFHKIQRISLEHNDDNEEEEEEYEDDDDHDNENNNDKVADGDVGGDNGVSADTKRESRFSRSWMISGDDKAEELQFERVRKAQKDKSIPLLKGKKSEVNSGDGIKSTKKANDAQGETFFGSLVSSFSGLFRKAEAEDGTKEGGKNIKNENNDDAFAKGAAQTNGIIDWLKWLSEKTGRLKSEPPPPPPPSESWMSYLNRWPFNSLFSLGKAAKPNGMPRRTAKRRPEGDRSDDACRSAASEEPISQTHFESLLHTLPGFVVNASNVKDVECKRQIQIFHHQLRGNKLWTMQMLDATGKITSGLLHGNINQFGDFDLCTQVKKVVKVTADASVRIRGKYCLAHIEAHTDLEELKVPLHLAQGRTLWNSHLGNPSHFVPRYGVANWGVCIPHLCGGSVVRELIQNNLRPYNVTGVEFRVEVNDNDCFTRQGRGSLTKLIKADDNIMARVTIISFGFLLLLVLTSSIADYWSEIWTFVQKILTLKTEANEISTEPENEAEQKYSENGESAEIGTAIVEGNSTSLQYLLSASFKSFSPRHTLAQLFSHEHKDMQFPVVHLLKVCATLMLYLCLKYLMLGHLPIINRDQLVNTVRHPLSVVFRSPMVYSDTLLVVSGFLAAYQFSEEMEQRGYIQLLKRLAAKLMRYLPTVYLVLSFQTWLLPHLGSGPLWTNIIGQQAQLCEGKMWRNLFSVQNAIDFEETCSPMTLQMALEMQLYVLGPLVVWLYYTDSDAGFFAYGAIHAMSVAARFSRTNREHLSTTLFHGMNISKFYRTANMLYSSPISRATPYLVGIGAGILQRTQAGELGVSTEFLLLGWLFSTASFVWCFWAASTGMRTDFIYSASDAAVYASWSPLLLGFAVVWIILMTTRDEHSLLCAVSSSRPVLFLSRISFPLQLATYSVVLYGTASVRDVSKFHYSHLLDIHEVFLIIICRSILALLIDMPARNIRHMLVERFFVEKPLQEADEEEPASGTEQSEPEMSEELSENVACETPEPPDTIWASDPEEEEELKVGLTHKRELSIKHDDVNEEEGEEITNESIEEIGNDGKEEDKEENHMRDSVEEKVVERVAEESGEGEDKEVVEENKGLEGEEIEEDEEEDDIAEEEEIKRRPSPTKSLLTTKSLEPTFTRRRRPISEDN